MGDLIKIIKIKTAKELFKEVSVTGKYKKLIGNYLFRGHEKEEWELIPSIFRESNLKLLFTDDEKERECSLEGFHFRRIIREQGLVYEFYREVSEKGLEIPRVETIEQYKKNDYKLMDKELKKKDYSEWIENVDMEEVCALCQHYDIPTRLLDWTKDIYVAIYFSVKNLFESKNSINEIEKEKQMAIWAFNFEKIKEYNLYCAKLNEEIEYINSLKEKNQKWKINTMCSDDISRESYNKKISLSNKNTKLDIFKEKELTKENLKIYKYNIKVKEYNNNLKDGEYKEYKKFLIPISSVIPPYYANPNINAQKGILLYQKTCYSALEEAENLFGFNKKKVKEWETSEEYKVFKLPLDEIVKRYINKEIAKELKINKLFYKFLIPQKEILNMMEYLYKLSYDVAKIFPGYYGISKKIFEQNKLYIFQNEIKNFKEKIK